MDAQGDVVVFTVGKRTNSLNRSMWPSPFLVVARLVNPRQVNNRFSKTPSCPTFSSSVSPPQSLKPPKLVHLEDRWNVLHDLRIVTFHCTIERPWYGDARF